MVCHFGPVRDFASRTEAIMAMLQANLIEPEYSIILVDGDWTDGPLPRQPEVTS